MLNSDLKILPDGSGTGHQPVSFSIATNGGEPWRESGEIYWPFAIYECEWDQRDQPALWKVTHLPSGYCAGGPHTKRNAKALIKALRALNVDWEFEKPKGGQWDRVAAAVKSSGIGKKFRAREVAVS